MRLHLGHAAEVLRVSTANAGTFTKSFVLDAGSLIAGLVIRANSGTVTASIAAQAGAGETVTVVSLEGFEDI